jgi:hypothetical protein
MSEVQRWNKQAGCFGWKEMAFDWSFICRRRKDMYVLR